MNKNFLIVSFSVALYCMLFAQTLIHTEPPGQYESWDKRYAAPQNIQQLQQSVAVQKWQMVTYSHEDYSYQMYNSMHRAYIPNGKCKHSVPALTSRVGSKSSALFHLLVRTGISSSFLCLAPGKCFWTF